VDTAEHGVRAKVAAAAERGGFVLLVGGSSVGKTRSAVEAVKALLPDWWLVHPAGPGEVAALAAAPVPRMVVWLDELQRYLDSEHGLTGGAVRALLAAPHPVVIIGTLWPDRYTAYTTIPAPGGADPRAREREVLDLAAVVRVGAAFSPAEQDRAHAAGVRDRRLAMALTASGYGLTQTLAAAPQLVARWEDAQTTDPYAWAVLTAALDAARLGARAPLSIDLLRAAAPGYCTSAQQAEAPENWFEQALAYATGKLHGAAAALNPAGVAMGHVTGYTAADYLIQHANRERRYERVPASTWDAVLSYLRDPADTARLAKSAGNRLLYSYAIPLYRHAARAGDEVAAFVLAGMLAGRGDLDGLRARADAGDGFAAQLLADLLAGGVTLKAAVMESQMLAGRGDLDEAAKMLRSRASVGDADADAAVRMAGLLARSGDLDEAIKILRPRADAGNRAAARWLVDLLAGRGDLDELRARADAGDGYAAVRLADLLAGRGDLDELRARADAGDGYAAVRLADLLGERGDLDEAVQMLRTRAHAGDTAAAVRLPRLLAAPGDLDEAIQILRARADADTDAAVRLAELLAEHGDLDEAVRILRTRTDAGDGYAALRLADLLAKRGDLDELRARTDAGDQSAAWWLADLLAGRGDLDELRARTDAGDADAAVRLAQLLADLLIKQGQREEAERLRRFGLNPDGAIACA